MDSPKEGETQETDFEKRERIMKNVLGATRKGDVLKWKNRIAEIASAAGVPLENIDFDGSARTATWNFIGTAISSFPDWDDRISIAIERCKFDE